MRKCWRSLWRNKHLQNSDCIPSIVQESEKARVGTGAGRTVCELRSVSGHHDTFFFPDIILLFFWKFTIDVLFNNGLGSPALFLTRVGLFLACTYYCARQRTRSARVGICGVEVFSRQLFRHQIILTGQHLIHKQFPFQKSTSTTILNVVPTVRSCLRYSGRKMHMSEGNPLLLDDVAGHQTLIMTNLDPPKNVQRDLAFLGFDCYG